MWEDFGKALTNVAFAGVGLAALAAEQVVKAGKVLAEKGEIYVEQGKRYGEELQQKLQEDAQRRREEQLEQRISAMDAQEREALRRRLAELDELELLDAACGLKVSSGVAVCVGMVVSAGRRSSVS
jgi:polyhydroxyalkanoate synthesis regulator phasin